MNFFKWDIPVPTKVHLKFSFEKYKKKRKKEKKRKLIPKLLVFLSNITLEIFKTAIYELNFA